MDATLVRRVPHGFFTSGVAQDWITCDDHYITTTTPTYYQRVRRASTVRITDSPQKLLLEGHHHGIKPIKQPSGRLLWKFSDLVILLNGGVKPRWQPGQSGNPKGKAKGSLKNERYHGVRYETHADMKAAVFEYIEIFYNRIRQHSTLGYKSPIQFFDRWISEQNHEMRAA